MLDLDGRGAEVDYSEVLNDGAGPGYRVLATCNGGNCPTVLVQDGDDDVLIQGYPVPEIHRRLGTPAGEAVVRIPRSVFLEAAGRLTSPAY